MGFSLISMTQRNLQQFIKVNKYNPNHSHNHSPCPSLSSTCTREVREGKEKKEKEIPPNQNTHNKETTQKQNVNPLKTFQEGNQEILGNKITTKGVVFNNREVKVNLSEYKLNGFTRVPLCCPYNKENNIESTKIVELKGGSKATKLKG